MRIVFVVWIFLSSAFATWNSCFGQQAIVSIFVPRGEDRPTVAVMPLSSTGNNLLKPAKSNFWEGIPLNNLATINAKMIQRELDLSPTQASKFRELERRFMGYAVERLKNAFQKIADDDSVRGEKKLVPARKVALKNGAALNLQSDEEIKDLLVPSQYQRLNELRHQVNEKRLGTAQYLLTPELKKALGISKEQIAKIKDAEMESNESIRKAALEKRRQLRNELLDELSEPKKREFNKRFGKEYDWK